MGLVFAGNRAKRDGDAVPAVDGDDGEGQVDQLFGRELLIHALAPLGATFVRSMRASMISPFEGWTTDYICWMRRFDSGCGVQRSKDGKASHGGVRLAVE